MNIFPRFQPALLFGAALVFSPVLAAQADPSFTTVVLSRKLLPVQNAKIRMGSFGAPTINTRGAIAFYGTGYGSGIGTKNNTFIARIQGTRGRLIVQEGQATFPYGVYNSGPPAVPWSGAYFTKFGPSPQINDKMQVSWRGEVIQFYTGTNPTTFGGQNTRLNVSQKNGSQSTYSLYPDGGATPNTDFSNRGTLSVVAKDLSNQPDKPETVFRQSASNFFGLVAIGETAIGLPLDSNYRTFGDPCLDDKNFVYFAADVENTDNRFDGIWYGKNGDPLPLVVKGQVVPGGNRTVTTFSAFSSPPVPSPSGKYMGFAASTSAGTKNGVWVVDVASKAVTTVATTSSKVLGYNGTLSNFQPPAVNNLGEVVFGIQISTTVINSNDFRRVDALFYASKPGASLSKIVAVGDTFEINGENTKVIDIRFSPNGGLSDVGKIAFTASFDNRTSGIFIAKP